MDNEFNTTEDEPEERCFQQQVADFAFRMLPHLMKVVGDRRRDEQIRLNALAMTLIMKSLPRRSEASIDFSLRWTPDPSASGNLHMYLWEEECIATIGETIRSEWGHDHHSIDVLRASIRDEALGPLDLNPDFLAGEGCGPWAGWFELMDMWIDDPTAELSITIDSEHLTIEWQNPAPG